MKSEKWQMENDNYKRKTKLLLKNEFLVLVLAKCFLKKKQPSYFH